MAIRVARNMASPNILEFIPLAEEYSLSETEPPKHFLGQTLIELDLRKRFQITVIAIKDVLTDQFIPAPPPNYRIKDSDVLIILGKTEDIEKSLRPGR
jgi:trk system potassium uptake protein TrkA